VRSVFAAESKFTSSRLDNVGLMPYRRRIVAVSECRRPLSFLVSESSFSVGHPIHVKQCDKPSLEEVRQVQEMYIDELTRCVTFALSGQGLLTTAAARIWNKYKDTFAKARVRELMIVD